MSWDAFQRAALEEMGLTLYRVPSSAVPAQAPAVLDETAPQQNGELGMLELLAKVTGVPVAALQRHAVVVAASVNLRGNAAGKRALWPYLRRLRRG